MSLRQRFDLRPPFAALPPGQVLVGACIGLLVGALTPGFTIMVRDAGRYITHEALEADYLFGGVWAVVLGIGILLWPVSIRDKRTLLLLWIAKCVVTLGFMLAYEWNYALDAHTYFTASLYRQFDFSTLGFGTGSESTVALAWLQNSVFPDSYHATKVSFSMVGLISVYLTYRGAVSFLGKEDRRLLLLLGLFPSVLFWSSILGKDPVQLLGISIYVFGVMTWRSGRTVQGIIFILMGVLVATAIRLWMGPILLVPLVVYAVVVLRSWVSRVAVSAICMAALWVTVSSLAGLLELESLEDVYTRADIIASTGGFEGGSGQNVSVQFDGIGSMIAFIPLGTFTALFRPLPGEVMNPFGLLAGVENIFLLSLVGLALVRGSWSDLKEPLVVWAIAVVASWAAVYSFISVYNLGAAVRFKLQVLPLLLCLLLYLARDRAPKASEQ